MGQPPGPWTDQAVLPPSQEDRGGAPRAGGPWPTSRELVQERRRADRALWLGWRQQVRPISPVTVANYRGAIDRYILPNLGRVKVQQVDASTIDALYEHVRARGGKCRHCWQRVRRGIPPLRVGERYRPRPGADELVHKLDCVNGWPLSASAVREVHSVLSGAFKQALVWGWIAHNPVKQATAPSTGSAGISPPDAQGVARLLEVARDEDPELGLFLRLAVVLGARRGELCGLKWRDVDLDNGEVFIASGVVRVAGRPLIDKDTKTHAMRRVAVGADTVELLRSYRVRQVQAALAVGASLSPDAYVFSQRVDGSKPASPDGVPIASSNSPPVSACVPAYTIFVTSWLPNSSPAAWTGGPSRAEPATPTAT